MLSTNPFASGQLLLPSDHHDPSGPKESNKYSLLSPRYKGFESRIFDRDREIIINS